MIKSKLDGVKEVELDMTTPEDLVGCSYSLPIVDYVKCSKCNQIVPNVTEDEYEVTDVFEYDTEFGRTDEYGEYTGRKEFTCPNCNKTAIWDPDDYDDEPYKTIYTDDLQDISNIDDIVPGFMEVYDAVYKIYEENGEDDWAKAFDIYMQQKGGNKKVKENKEVKQESKSNLQEATIKALYDGLKDNTEIDDVEGLVDDVLVVTDPEITTDEYNEVIERAEEIIEDTPEGEIPLDPTYLGEYLQICPICGGSFIEDHILEPGTACPICYETPESFVMVGKLQAEEVVAEDNGLEGEEEVGEEEEFTPTPIEEFGEEETEETVEPEEEPVETVEEPVETEERPRGARTRRNREVASKELPQGNILTENKEEKDDLDLVDEWYASDDVKEIKEEDNNEQDNADEIKKDDGKELLLGAEEDDEAEYTVEMADENKIKELADKSAFTWEGMDTSKESLKKIVDDLKKNTSIELPVKFYIFTGKTMNDIYHLTEDNAYQDDIHFVSIDLDNWSEMGNLPIFKIKVKARWLDDIVGNNMERQNEIDAQND